MWVGGGHEGYVWTLVRVGWGMGGGWTWRCCELRGGFGEKRGCGKMEGWGDG